MKLFRIATMLVMLASVNLFVGCGDTADTGGDESVPLNVGGASGEGGGSEPVLTPPSTDGGEAPAAEAGETPAAEAGETPAAEGGEAPAPTE